MKGNIMKKIILVLAFGMFFSGSAMAETCTALPSCEELGYAKGYTKECGTNENNYILCPYDKEYRKCANYSCAGIGFTTDDKTEWCATIVPCKFDSSYTLCAAKKE